MPSEQSDIHIVTGLPYGDFDVQRDEMEDFLAHFTSMIHFKSGPHVGKTKKVQFRKYTILPQAAGSLIPKNSQETAENFEGIIDVGYKTTDIVVFENRGKSSLLRTDLCDTIDIAASNVYEQLQKVIRAKLGCRLDIGQIENALAKGYINFRGRRHSLVAEVKTVKQTVSKTIIDMVRAKWRDNTDLMDGQYFLDWRW